MSVESLHKGCSQVRIQVTLIFCRIRAFSYSLIRLLGHLFPTCLLTFKRELIGSVYEGQFFDAQKHGEGRMVWIEKADKKLSGGLKSYRGQWRADQPHGRGIATNSSRLNP